MAPKLENISGQFVLHMQLSVWDGGGSKSVGIELAFLCINLVKNVACFNDVASGEQVDKKQEGPNMSGQLPLIRTEKS